METGRTDPLRRARSLLARGDTTAAIATLKTLVLQQAPPPPAFVLLGSVLRSRATIRSRLESQHILEDGIRLYPENDEIRIELGKTYYAQQFFPDAARCFSAVLARDSSNCEVLHYLGENYFRKWKRNQGFKDELARAVSLFKRAAACDPSDSSNAFSLAFGEFALGDSSASRARCEDAVRSWPGAWRFRLLLGVLYLSENRLRGASDLFQQALALMRPDERSRFQDISLLLDDDKRMKYTRAPARQKRRMRRIFWVENDPDPTTEVNERYLEHLGRIVLAELYFSPWNRPSPDSAVSDRGIALIKFGWPTRIEYDLGGGLTGRSETWIYMRGEEAFQFTFMDEYLNDRFSIPMDAGYMKRELVEKSSQSTVIRTVRTVPGKMAIYSFANESRPPDSYLYLAVDFSGRRALCDTATSAGMLVRTTVFDNDWTTIDQFESPVTPGAVPFEGDSILYVTRRLSLPFGIYHIAAALEDSLSRIQSVFRGDLGTMRFLGGSLLMSDLVLYEHPAAPGRKHPLDRNGTTIVPSVYNRFDRGDKLGVYFEIYNLERFDRRAGYDVSYYIFEAPPGGTSSWSRIRSFLRGSPRDARNEPPALSQTISFAGTTATAAQSIVIDIGSLEEGRYELQVAIFDRVASERTMSSVLFYRSSRR